VHWNILIFIMKLQNTAAESTAPGYRLLLLKPQNSESDQQDYSPGARSDPACGNAAIVDHDHLIE
jgi:hypothetical protein